MMDDGLPSQPLSSTDLTVQLKTELKVKVS